MFFFQRQELTICLLGAFCLVQIPIIVSHASLDQGCSALIGFHTAIQVNHLPVGSLIEVNLTLLHCEMCHFVSFEIGKVSFLTATAYFLDGEKVDDYYYDLLSACVLVMR